MDTLTKMCEDFPYRDDDFDKCFNEFDTDGNGTIDKEEMLIFIKKIAGISCWEPTTPQSVSMRLILSGDATHNLSQKAACSDSK